MAIAETKRIRIEPGFLGGGVSYIEAPFGPNVLAISPDEKRLAAGGRDGLVRIFDLSNGSSRLVLNGHRNETLIRSIAYSPDGSRLLTAGGSDGTARLFASDRQLGGPELLPGIDALAFHPKEQMAAFSDKEGNIHIWNLVSRKKLSTLQARPEWASPSAPKVLDLAYRSNSQLLCSYSDGRLRTWDPVKQVVESERELHIPLTKSGGLDRPYTCRFSPDVRWLVGFSLTGAFEKAMNVFSTSDGRPVIETTLVGSNFDGTGVGCRPGEGTRPDGGEPHWDVAAS